MAQFIDYAQITVASGNGGDGAVAWRREKYVAYGGPAGGDGGKGGDVWIEATEDLNTLLAFQQKHDFKAQNGGKGEIKNCHGRNGQDMTIFVPCGTVIRDLSDGKAIGDLANAGDRILVAQGGRGGRGNARFTSSRRQAPSFAEPGEPCVERTLALELKLLADVGLVGLPNAGKSTLLSVMSAAKPKIANYPFTTLTPNLGVVKDVASPFVLADIPGLIEGASEGHGLGHDFLRHIERTRVLWHLIDVSPLAMMPPVEAYELIHQEMAKYNANLKDKPEFIILTKLDTLGEPSEWEPITRALESKTGRPVLSISAATHQGLTTLLQQTQQALSDIPKDYYFEPIAEDTKATNHDDSAFELEWIDDQTLRLNGGKLERLAKVTDIENRPAMHRLMNIYTAMGVFKRLEKERVAPGTTVFIGRLELVYEPDDIEAELNEQDRISYDTLSS